MNFLQFGFMATLFARVILSITRARHGKVAVTEQEGDLFRVRIARGKRKNVIRVSVALDMPEKLRLRLRAETGFDRFAKNLGIVREWQLGDAGFDDRIFIISEDWAFNDALSADRELRKICGQLISRAGDAAIECRGRKLYFDMPYSGSKDERDEAVASRVVNAVGPTLRKLRDGLQKIAEDRWEFARDLSLRRKAWLVGICGALGIAGGVALHVGVDDDFHQVVHAAIPSHAALVSAVLVGGLLAAAWLWLKASPNTHAVLLDVLFAALPGSYLAAHAGFLHYNESHDRGEARLVPVQVEDTWLREHKRSKNYYLEVSGWPDERGDRTMEISASQFEWIESGACITAIWHPGALGDGWVSDYQSGCPREGDVER